MSRITSRVAKVRVAACASFVFALALQPSSTHAQSVCPESCSVAVTIADPARNFIVTVPDGTGETFAEAGITIRVTLKDCQGQPIVGVPAAEVLLFNSGLCICPGGHVADGPTDANGVTTFSGPLRAGGCVSNLGVYAYAILIGTIPVGTRSPDVMPTSPCSVDAGDAVRMLQSVYPGSSGCSDLNRDGHVGYGDIAYCVHNFSATCYPYASQAKP